MRQVGWKLKTLFPVSSKITCTVVFLEWVSSPDICCPLPSSLSFSLVRVVSLTVEGGGQKLVNDGTNFKRGKEKQTTK